MTGFTKFKTGLKMDRSAYFPSHAMRVLRRLTAVMAVAAFSGCATESPTYRPAAAKPTEAVIYVFRRGQYYGSAVSLDVACDGVRFGTVPNAGYVFTVVDPGAHVISSKTECDSTVRINAKAGSSYFVELSLVSGFLVAEPNLAMVDAEAGEANISSTHLHVDPPPRPPPPPARGIHDR